MAKILITGINGFVGRNLACRLGLNGHEVVGTARSTVAGAIQCDIESPAEIISVVCRENPDVIVHTAALSSVTDGQTMDYYRTNVLGTENLLRAVDELGARRRFIYISTAGVYGNQGVGVLSENLCPRPVSHYGISKLAGEYLVRGEFSTRHDVTIVRPFNLVGPGQKPGFIFPKIVSHFKEKKPEIRLGNLDPVRDYLDIRSSCNYIEQLIFNSDAFGEIVNLCSGRGTSVRELLGILSNITSHTIRVDVVPEFVRKNEVWSLLGDVDKLNKLCQEKVVLMPTDEILSRMLAAN